MICHKCQKNIPDTSVLCPECGAPLKSRPAGNKLKLGIGGSILVCLVIAIVCMIYKPTINLNNYLTVTFEGYDTVGKAVITFDTQKFEKDYGKKIKSIESFLSDCVDGSLDVESDLSNGDVVTYTWKCNDKYAIDNYDYKLKYSDMTYTVSGLKKIKKFDPFIGVDVVFEGIAPYGEASLSITTDDLVVEDFTYELDVKDGLSNGDTVTVTATLDNQNNPEDYCIENYGMVPKALSKTYTVNGLDSYIKSLDEITKESLNTMKNQAEAVYNADVEDVWEDDEELKSLTYLGSYLLTKKEKEQYMDSFNNTLYLVYKAQIKNEYSNNGKAFNKTSDIYWYIAFNDLIVSPDGEVIFNIANYETPSDTVAIDSGIDMGWWSTRIWYYFGYQTLDKLYEDAVKSKTQVYSLEDNVDERITATEIEEE